MNEDTSPAQGFNSDVSRPGSHQSAACPVCGTPGVLFASYSIEQAAAHFCPQTRNADRYHRLTKCISRLWGNEACSVLHCPDCGFGFSDPFVGGDEEFYGILHEQYGYPRWRWDYDVALTLAIEPLGGGRVLDVGAGTGTFLGHLGPNWSKHAVEGSPTMRNKLRAIGIHVFESLQLAQKEAGTFRLITLFQVLEHLSEFASTLHRCRVLLAAGGIIFITVPEASAMRRQEELTGCADMPPNHVCKWTPRSLQLALRAAGFSPGEPVFEPASWSTLRGAIHLRILADRERRNSVAAHLYRFQNRALRIAGLTLLALPTFFRMMPHLSALSKGGAFAMRGVAQ